MITLTANKFLGALTNLIAYTQVANTTNEGEVGRFVQSFQNTSVENGNGKVVLASDLPEVADLSETSSILTAKKPTVDEQYIPVENFKVIQMTINNYLMRGAFVEETQLANFVGYLISTMQSAKIKYLSDAIINEIENYTPEQESQTVTVKLFKTDGLLDPAQLQKAQTYNANAIQKAFINTLLEMSYPTNKYNDLTYTEIIDFSAMKLIVKTNVDTDILVDSLAYLLNSNKITEAQRWSRTYPVPAGQFSDDTTSAWLMHNDKIQFGYFYQVATEFFDPSTLNTNNWLHFAYYLDTIKAYPCVKFNLDYSLTPTALA